MPNVSPSKIDSARTCPRRVWFVDVADIRSPQHPAAALGEEVNDIIDCYMVEGTPPPNSKAGDIALVLTPAVPMGTVDKSDLQGWVSFKYRGVQFKGKLDWREVGRINDFKTTSDFRYAKDHDQLIEDPQAIIYCIGEFLRDWKKSIFDSGESDDDVLDRALSDIYMFCANDGSVGVGFGPYRFRHLVARTKPPYRLLEPPVEVEFDLYDLLTKFKLLWENEIVPLVKLWDIQRLEDVPHNAPEACKMYPPDGCFFRQHCEAVGTRTRPTVRQIFTKKETEMPKIRKKRETRENTPSEMSGVNPPAKRERKAAVEPPVRGSKPPTLKEAATTAAPSLGKKVRKRRVEEEPDVETPEEEEEEIETPERSKKRKSRLPEPPPVEEEEEDEEEDEEEEGDDTADEEEEEGDDTADEEEEEGDDTADEEEDDEDDTADDEEEEEEEDDEEEGEYAYDIETVTATEIASMAKDDLYDLLIQARATEGLPVTKWRVPKMRKFLADYIRSGGVNEDPAPVTPVKTDPVAAARADAKAGLRLFINCAPMKNRGRKFYMIDDLLDEARRRVADEASKDDYAKGLPDDMTRSYLTIEYGKGSDRVGALLQMVRKDLDGDIFIDGRAKGMDLVIQVLTPVAIEVFRGC